ncbi:MAG: hypothetical protein PHX36_09060, partial [Mesotoga sp.]|uniref:hypothetical protein n=1 Tax=Mesotoga sp. TaxID=2053577 RepID=UPI00261F52B0
LTGFRKCKGLNLNSAICWVFRRIHLERCLLSSQALSIISMDWFMLWDEGTKEGSYFTITVSAVVE